LKTFKKIKKICEDNLFIENGHDKDNRILSQISDKVSNSIKDSIKVNKEKYANKFQEALSLSKISEFGKVLGDTIEGIGEGLSLIGGKETINFFIDKFGKWRVR